MDEPDSNLVLTFCILCGVGGFIILIGLIAILKTCITACANAIRGSLIMAANLQYNVYRFFEYWQQGIDQIYLETVTIILTSWLRCPFYRDGDILLYDGSTFY